MVKLFNLIQQAQSQDKKPVVNHRSERPVLPNRSMDGLRSEQKQRTKTKDRNSVDERGKEGLLLFTLLFEICF